MLAGCGIGSSVTLPCYSRQAPFYGDSPCPEVLRLVLVTQTSVRGSEAQEPLTRAGRSLWAGTYQSGDKLLAFAVGCVHAVISKANVQDFGVSG